MKQSKKMQPYFVIKYQGYIIVILGLFVFFLGFWGFSSIDNGEKFSVLHSIVLTLGLFVFEWIDYENSPVLDIATILAIGVTSFGLFSILFSKHFNNWHIKRIQKKPYELLIGLSEQNIALLEKSYSGEPTIIIEKDKDHTHIEYFKERGFGVKALDANKAIWLLNLTWVTKIVISTSNDRKNIALGKQLLNFIKENQESSKVKREENKRSIYVSIGNRDLSVLFKQNVISNGDSKNTNVFAFSLYENMAKKLFLEHSILGYQPTIIKDSEKFSMIVVGDSDLALEIVYHLAFLSTLPNENPLVLHLIDANASQFKSKIEKTFPNINLIPHLSIEVTNIDNETLEFYQDKLWECDNLTNIFIATKNEEKNLEIAINLQDTTYIEAIGHNRFNTKVLFALYHNLGLGEEINNNSDTFENFFTFGNIEETSTREILFDEDLDYIAKLIHLNYRGVKEIDRDEMYNNWIHTSPHKRDANKTQALHIDIKLLAFGLKKIKVKTKDLVDRLTDNREMFERKLEYSQEIKEELASYKLDYFPKDFTKRYIDSVARSEHNRWNAFHYLNGWSHNFVRNDEAKEHTCLLQLEVFPDEIKESYQYDLASVYNIPEYLAHAGYEIVEIEEESK